MRLQGKTFIPGIKFEANDDEEELDERVISPHTNGEINYAEREIDANPVFHNTEPLAVNEQEEQTALRRTGVPNEAFRPNDESQSSDEEDSPDEVSENSEFETECYESYTRFRKKQNEPIVQLEGIDWESVNYQLKKLQCEEDEITGLDVSSSYIAVQYYIESGIDIYDRKSFKHLFRLDGHEYGGQCLKISDSGSDLEPPDKNLSDDNHRSLLYSASMDCSLKSWNLKKQCMVDSIMDHCDYVQNLTLYRTEKEDFIATGGRGDKAIFVYKSSNEGKFNRLFKLQGHTGWVTQTIFIDCLKPNSTSSQEPKDETKENNQQCPKYLLSGSEDGTIKLWDLHDMGKIRFSLEQDAGISCMIQSNLKGCNNTLIVFGDREGKMSYLDLGTHDQLKKYSDYSSGCGNSAVGVGHMYGDNDVDDDDEPLAIHLLPNILIGTGKYCRSCKYHDKAVDTSHLTDNGYLITASAGSKYVKIWKINVPTIDENGSDMQKENSLDSEGLKDDQVFKYDLEKTEVRELQILRDHSDYLSILCVYGDSIYSSCSDGHIYSHTFPELSKDTVHYDMAFDEEGAIASALATTTLRKTGEGNPVPEEDTASKGVTTQLLSSPESSTEVCDGPRLCRTGKTGLVKSSSSFQVSFQLKPSVCSIGGSIKLPTSTKPAAIQEEDEWDPDSDSDVDDSDEYEVEYEYVSDEDSDSY